MKTALIGKELVHHLPFTVFGAITGIAIMVLIILGQIPASIHYTIFYTLHPLHVLLSSVVTTAMYSKYHRRIWMAVLIGYTGSIGIATLSDAVIPYLGGLLLGIQMEFNIPFIEEWWLVNPLAFVGITIGYWKQTTRVPHSGHVLLSTWASLFYFTTFGSANWILLIPYVFSFLIISVWTPCCISDVVFPLLFVKGKRNSHGSLHSHILH